MAISDICVAAERNRDPSMACFFITSTYPMTSNGRSASGLLCATRVYLLLGGVRGYDNVRKEQESSADDSRQWGYGGVL